MNYCVKCGKPIADGMNLCENCAPKRYAYAVEYVKNGFWFGGFKRDKLTQVINNYGSQGWKVAGMTYHTSVFLLIFRRSGTVVTFERPI